LRQRGSGLVRKTLSFSKNVENYVGAIWNFIHEYNCLLREKMAENDTSDIFSILYYNRLPVNLCDNPAV
jgi:insertion element IS1 protein InsB